jgi:hypothetical protein
MTAQGGAGRLALDGASGRSMQPVDYALTLEVDRVDEE